MQKNNADEKKQTLGLPGLSFVVAGARRRVEVGYWGLEDCVV